MSFAFDASAAKTSCEALFLSSSSGCAFGLMVGVSRGAVFTPAERSSLLFSCAGGADLRLPRTRAVDIRAKVRIRRRLCPLARSASPRRNS